jgi:hypothetical protein
MDEPCLCAGHRADAARVGKKKMPNGGFRPRKLALDDYGGKGSSSKEAIEDDMDFQGEFEPQSEAPKKTACKGKVNRAQSKGKSAPAQTIRTRQEAEPQSEAPKKTARKGKENRAQSKEKKRSSTKDSHSAAEVEELDS